MDGAGVEGLVGLIDEEEEWGGDELHGDVSEVTVEGVQGGGAGAALGFQAGESEDFVDALLAEGRALTAGQAQAGGRLEVFEDGQGGVEGI
jgi:hypothetical protein